MLNRFIKLSFKNKIFLGSICLIFILLELIYSQNSPETKQSDLSVVSGTLARDPEFDKSRNGWYFEIRLKEFGNLRFHTDINSYPALKKELLKTNLVKGSSVNILIKNDDSKSLGDGLNRALNLYDIICLKDKKNEYITLEDYNKEEYRHNHFWLAYFCWLIFVGAFVFWILKNKKKHSIDKNPVAF